MKRLDALARVVLASMALSLSACRGQEHGGASSAAPPSPERPSAADGALPALETLGGTWVAELSHNGTTERLSLELVPNTGGTVVRAFVSIPAIDVWEYSIGTATMSGDMMRVGSMELRYDPDGPRLLGTVPPSLAPSQTIALELRRADPIESPVPAPDLPAPEIAWTHETGGRIWAGITISEGKVLAGSDDGVAYALDLEGRELWRFTTDAPVRADPIVHRDAVLIHSDDGFLYRVAADSGELQWKVPLAKEPLRRVPFGAAGFRYDHYGAAPDVFGERVYVGHERDVHALELGTGATLWTKRLPDSTTSSPVVAGGKLFLGSFDGNVYALDPESGDVVWTHDTGAPVPSSVAVHDDPDLVIVGSRSYDLLALDAADGSEVWTYYNWFSWVESSPTLANGTIYVGSSDRQLLHAIDAVSGSLVWKFDTRGSAWARPAVSERAVFIGAVGVAGYLVPHEGGFFAVERETGRGLWHLPSSKPDDAALWGFAASPAVGEGVVVAGGLDGRIYAFRDRR